MTRERPADTNELARGQAQLDTSLARLEQELEARIQQWSDRTLAKVTTPLRTTLESAAEAHRALMEEAELSAPDRPWGALQRYREGVAREVVAPLRMHLERTRPGERLATEWSDFLGALPDTSELLPARLVRPEPPDLHSPLPGDGPIRRLRKVTARTGRGVAGIFRGKAPRPQVVHLERLARQNLQGEAIPGVVDLVADLEQSHGICLGVLEAGLARWARDWFPQEDRVHVAQDHLTPETSTMLRRLVEMEVEATGRENDEEAASPEKAAPTEQEAAPGEATEATGNPGEVAGALQEALEEAAQAVPSLDPVVERVRSGVGRLYGRLLDEVRVTGTGMAPRRNRAEADRLERLGERMARVAREWAGWYDAVLNRVRLTGELLKLRSDVDTQLDTLFRDVLDTSVGHLDQILGEARDGLLELRAQAAAPESDLLSASDPETLAREAEECLSRAEAILEEAVQKPLEPQATVTPVRDRMDRAVEEVNIRLRRLPELLQVHPLRENRELPDPARHTRDIRLREAVQQTLDALRLEGLRTSVHPLTQYLDEARAEAREIPRVVAYNLNAAREELLGEHGEEVDPDAVMEDARTLTLQGLDRTAQALDQVTAGAAAPFQRFTEDAHRVLHPALVQAHGRVTLDRAVQEQIRDVRSILERWTRVVRGWLEKESKRLTSRADRWWKRSRIRFLRLLRRGRAVVGAGGPEEAEAERALEVLRSMPSLMDSLPLVYRRLFSLQPVTDPSLLVGREDEIRWVKQNWSTWRDGAASPCLLTGVVTVGHTSLMNVLENSAFPDATVVRLTLLERDKTPEELATRLARALCDAGVLSGDPERSWDLPELGDRLRERAEAEATGPLVILLEHLEHLFLRTPGGTRTLERFLDFQARTASAVFWLSSTSTVCWKLVQKVEPRATALLRQGEVSEVDRAEMEKLLMTRHQRSGVPLEFLPPQDAPALLRRKLQRTRDPEARQAVLREEFFDRLYKGSQGNVPMGILLWLRAADFSTRSGWVQLRLPRPVRFSFLEELDLAVDFGLMALLQHGSLTMEEFATVFATDLDQAYQSLEVLRSRSLLGTYASTGGLPEPVRRIEPGVRYRIPPTLTTVVARYLRDHNILH